jgi:hypothetical protein
LARNSTKTPEAAAKPASGKASGISSAEAGGQGAGLNRLARRRGKVLVILGVALLFGLGVKAVWQRASPIVASRERYILPANRITMTPPPEWIVADVCGEVIHNAVLNGRLSILDADFVENVKHAFALHPWVASVERVKKDYPPAVHVEVTYRQPVAVVETAKGELLPVDAAGSHLPADDVPLIRRQYLPRITGIVGQPPIGQKWSDARVQGAIEIVSLLGSNWEPLHLAAISPRARPEISGERQFFVYDIVTRGGTQIIWGASPQAQAPGEAAFADKLQRLRSCIEKHGPLDSVKAPGKVDVRGELQVEPRMVKKPGARVAEKAEEDEATVIK